MRSSRPKKPSPYEVRCPRCDVSFPVGTRTCLHCGGPTGEAGPLFEMDDPAEYSMETGGEGYTISSSRPADAGAQRKESPFGVFEEAGIFQDDSRSEPANDRAYQQDAEPPSFVQTLMRSAGSFIWIAVLIAFSLSRSCGN